MTATKSTFGSVERIADVLRMNNPNRALLDLRTIAVIKTLAQGAEPEAVRLGYVLNAITAAELVSVELAEAE